ncbi:hypothetical protein GO001_03180 [Streptomyces sp. NRRL B-1677]|uniref:Uncharacterized protein n=1 Tax=Streptomyces klenkii TaxID=1420899 RepID=A0A3B0BDB0_9ACTN|nr:MULTISPECIES: hypothetical protein [Streptomyces]MBF6044224.1 hypothetical protein [Streptomyces sp. NRRL B-1677]RKN70344.1 hypothetical protein D7231_20960 [Streptomyces klenkii]
MTKWLIIAEVMVLTEGEAPYQRIETEVLRTVGGNRTREQALVELRKEAKKYRPAALKNTACVVGRESDGSFLILPKKSGKGHVRCTVRLIEEA